MNYAIGCAFNINEMFMNFPYKKLYINCAECKAINGDQHRDKLVKQIFRECFKLVINDVIDHNITFQLPTGAKKCDIHMKRVTGIAFQVMRQYGKWSDVDFIESNFTGYEIGLYMYGKLSPRIKTIYVNKPYKDRITQNTNKGMQYGDNCNDRTIKDYYQIMFTKYPQVPQSDIKRILKFGWKSLYLHNSYGGDTFITDRDIWCYIGYLKGNPLKHYDYYRKKLAIKLRILYKRKKISWDGYYYFALPQWQYDEILAQKKSKGRPKKKLKFKNLLLYQILDECKICESSKQYIFRIPYIAKVNYKFFIPEIVTDKAELIITRQPMKFKDILVYENEYEFL